MAACLALTAPLLLPLGTAQAAEHQQQQLAAATRLRQLLAPINTLSGHFTQLTVGSSGQTLQQSTGEMALRRPGLFRWHADQPEEQLVVSDGKQVWLYDPDLQQVTRRKLDQRISQTPALLLSGDVTQISRDFDISYGENGALVTFRLHPKAKDSLLDNLQISFQNGVPSRMLLIDNAGQRTDILFRAIKTNPKLDDGQFHFEVPKGADLIQE